MAVARMSTSEKFPAFGFSSTILSTARRSFSRRNPLFSRFETAAGKLPLRGTAAGALL